MKVVERLVGDVAVVEFAGKLDCGAGERCLQEVVEGLSRRGQLRVVIDLKNVEHLDTTCLGRLLTAHIRFQRGRGGVHLLQTPARIRHVISIVRLDHMLVTFDTEEEAVAAFRVAARESA
jgi:anti-anti-sigma factor